jgi:hypothetical protein
MKVKFKKQRMYTHYTERANSVYNSYVIDMEYCLILIVYMYTHYSEHANSVYNSYLIDMEYCLILIPLRWFHVDWHM